ncbi:MAG: hypothetical protein PVJ84_05225, partial [Desulfobacteraceae bacterium]
LAIMAKAVRWSSTTRMGGVGFEFFIPSRAPILFLRFNFQVFNRIVPSIVSATQRKSIDFKIMFLDCVIGRRGITIQLPPSSLAKNIILKPMVR